MYNNMSFTAGQRRSSVEIKLQECTGQAKFVTCVCSDEMNYAVNWIQVDDLNCCITFEMPVQLTCKLINILKIEFLQGNLNVPGLCLLSIRSNVWRKERSPQQRLSKPESGCLVQTTRQSAYIGKIGTIDYSFNYSLRLHLFSHSLNISPCARVVCPLGSTREAWHPADSRIQQRRSNVDCG